MSTTAFFSLATQYPFLEAIQLPLFLSCYSVFFSIFFFLLSFSVFFFTSLIFFFFPLSFSLLFLSLHLPLFISNLFLVLFFLAYFISSFSFFSSILFLPLRQYSNVNFPGFVNVFSFRVVSGQSFTWTKSSLEAIYVCSEFELSLLRLSDVPRSSMLWKAVLLLCSLIEAMSWLSWLLQRSVSCLGILWLFSSFFMASSLI